MIRRSRLVSTINSVPHAFIESIGSRYSFLTPLHLSSLDLTHLDLRSNVRNYRYFDGVWNNHLLNSDLSRTCVSTRRATSDTHPCTPERVYGGRRARRRMFPTCYVKVLNPPCNFGKRQKEVGYPRMLAPFAKQRDRLTNSSTRFAFEP